MLKKYILILILSLSFFSSTFAYKELIIENRDKKPVRVIKVVLDGEHYVISSVAEDGGATLQELVKKVGGDTAVNGTFFCPDDYSYCGGTTHTISERVYMGDGEDWSRFWPDTSIRMIFGFNKEGSPLLVQNNMGNMSDIGIWMKPDKEKWNSLYFGLGNFPIFLYDGEDVIEGYTTYIDAKMKTSGNKTFICSTQDNSTIYMGVIGGINLIDMPAYLKKNFDCRNAMNLDAGSSLGMIYSGFVLDQGPRKRIMDAFVVLTKEQYQNLTKEVPTYKVPFTPEPKYSLTDLDVKKVKTIYQALQPFIVKNGSKQKWSFISILRSAVTSPKIASDPQKLAIIKELLFKLFVIDSI